METSYGEYVIQNLTETKEYLVSKITSENSGRNLLGLLPMFVLILLAVLRVSWTVYRTFGKLILLQISNNIIMTGSDNPFRRLQGF